MYSNISDLFTESQTSISLRGKRRLVILRVNTTNYGLHSFLYHASKLFFFLSGYLFLLLAKNSSVIQSYSTE